MSKDIKTKNKNKTKRVKQRKNYYHLNKIIRNRRDSVATPSVAKTINNLSHPSKVASEAILKETS